MATKLNNAAAALNASNETKGGEVIETTLNNTAEQATQVEQVEQGGVKFTLNTPNPQFMNYLGTRADDFASEFEKFASEFDSGEFTRPSNKNAGKAFDSLLNLLISSEFLIADANFAKYMSEHNPLEDYTRPAIENARDYARAQLELLSKFGNKAEKAWQNFNRANKAPTNAELKAKTAEQESTIAEQREQLKNFAEMTAAEFLAWQKSQKGA